jgi:tetratricopeptide (TPR) repeat protein
MAIAAEVDAPHVLAYARLQHSDLFIEAGDWDARAAALVSCLELLALPAARPRLQYLEHYSVLSQVHWALAEDALYHARAEEAVLQAQTAAAIARQSGDRTMTVLALRRLQAALWLQGEQEQALAALTESVDLAEGLPLLLTELLVDRAELLLLMGRPQEAERCLPDLEGGGVATAGLTGRLAVMDVALARGDVTQAQFALERAAGMVPRGWVLAELQLAAARGRWLSARGDVPEARLTWADGLLACDQEGYRSGISSFARCLASDLARRPEDVESSVLLLGLAEAHAHDRGHPRLRLLAPDQTNLVGSCRQVLGDDRFERLWTRGQEMAVTEAVELLS